MTQAPTFAIADDHPLFRDALKGAIAPVYPDATILEAGNMDEAAALLAGDRDIDILLFDLHMPGARAYSGLILLRTQYPAVPIVVVSGSAEPPVIRRCINLGASGFIPKSSSSQTMRDAVDVVLRGGMWIPDDIVLDVEDESEEAALASRLATLTPQQVRVLMMLSEGLLNKQIAYELSVSEATVKAHVSAILQKLGVDSRTQAVIAASRIEAGLFRDDLSNGH
ncbi:MAG: response regulator transcription factor [Rhodobiaceae bacterium]|nr:response regulator transcription factor [Rhodobiaceae bacterium]